MSAQRLAEQFENLEKQDHAARLAMWVFLGSETLLHVRLADERVIQVKGSGESAAMEGQSIKPGFSKRHVHLFRQDGMALERKQPVADAMRVN